MLEPGSYERIAVCSIRDPAHQLRETIDQDRLGELIDSMAAEGLHQPVGLRGPLEDGTYEVIYGHRRTIAARTLGWELIDARVYPASFDPLLAAVSENFHRADLNPLEEAAIVQRMAAAGLPMTEIARRLRRSRAWCENRLELLELPPDLQAAIRDGSLSLSVARLLANVDDDRYRAALVHEAHRSGASTATVGVWLAHYAKDRELLVRNERSIETFLHDRDAFVVKAACGLCDGEELLERTRSWRVCARCAAMLEELRRSGEWHRALAAPTDPA